MKLHTAPSAHAPASETLPPATDSARETGAVPLSDLIERTPELEPRPAGAVQTGASGRSIELRPAGRGEDLLTVRSPEGQVEIEVRLTKEGPVIRASGAALQIGSAGKVSVDCEEFHVRARERIVQASGGELRQEAAGDATLKVKGHLGTEARTTTIRSRRGDTRVEANDDVKLKGERVRLNC